MITLKIDNKLYEVPSSFEEVNPKLFEKIARLIYASKSNYTMKKKVFELLVKSEATPLPSNIKKHITSEQWYELFKLIDFLFEATELNKIEKFLIVPATYFFPNASMAFSSVIEYAMADECLRRYADGEAAALNELVFTICRPREKTIDIDSASWNGDIRERYSSALVSRRALLKVPEHIQFFTVLFMLGCKRELSEKYPELFGKVVSEDTDNGDTDNGGEPSIISWLKLIKAVAETGIYGNYEETCHTNLHTFCLNVCFDIEKNEKMKSQNKFQNDL